MTSAGAEGRQGSGGSGDAETHGAGEPAPGRTPHDLPVQRGAVGSTALPLRAGRHAALEAAPDRSPAGARAVLVIGGHEPLGEAVARRLGASGRRLALHDVAVRPTAGPPDGAARDPMPSRPSVLLGGNRLHADDVAALVEGAEAELGGLDAVVVLPGRRRQDVRIDASGDAWADHWSQALGGDVLAAACAAQAAARSFLARRRAGRIVLVCGHGDPAGSGNAVGAVVDAALTALGADLARELGPRGIGVSVVAAGVGAAPEFAPAQVADVVEALLATPVLSGASVHIG